jgi:predicted nucleic acid-binding protein
VSKEEARTILADANSLIDLIKLAVLIPVTEMAEYHYLVTEEVIKEIKWPEQVKVLDGSLQKGKLHRVSLYSLEELALFARLQQNLDSGEAASLAYAAINGCFLLSDEIQGAFMREVRSHIGEKKLIRTATLLAQAIDSHIVSVEDLSARLGLLRTTATSSRDKDDVEHLARVLDRVKKLISGGK